MNWLTCCAAYGRCIRNAKDAKAYIESNKDIQLLGLSATSGTYTSLRELKDQGFNGTLEFRYGPNNTKLITYKVSSCK